MYTKVLFWAGIIVPTLNIAFQWRINGNTEINQMGLLLIQWLLNLGGVQVRWGHLLDVTLVLVLAYIVFTFIIWDRHTLWMVRGFIILMITAALSERLNLQYVHYALDKLLLGASIAVAFVFQAELRRLLEQLGRGNLWQLFQPSSVVPVKTNNVIDEIVDAVKDLSQSRTGALLIMETSQPIDEQDFSVPGVRINADVSRELLQTIFQTSTLLHDGAVLIRESRLVSAGVILPISERDTSRQLGTRHRAAMGITERVDHCLCIVVSEETGSISVAEQGLLNRPLTSSKLKELLQARFTQNNEREVVSPQLRSLGRRINQQMKRYGQRLFQQISSLLKEK